MAAGPCREDHRLPLTAAALFVAHPGHELRVFGWMSEARPLVQILTDGSGAANASRMPSAARLVQDLGASAGDIFPAASDAELYRALLAGETGFFLGVAEQLALSLCRHKIGVIAGDAAEGFNPAHDVCRAIIDAAVALAEGRSGREILNYQFSLTEWLDHGAVHDGRCVHRGLDDAAFAAKCAAARAYAGIESEVDQALHAFGENYFRRECLRPAEDSFLVPSRMPKPYYERVGEERVASGAYRSVIRYGVHVYPVIAALRAYADAACAPLVRQFA
jgi:hypothetical protein